MDESFSATGPVFVAFRTQKYHYAWPARRMLGKRPRPFSTCNNYNHSRRAQGSGTHPTAGILNVVRLFLRQERQLQGNSVLESLKSWQIRRIERLTIEILIGEVFETLEILIFILENRFFVFDREWWYLIMSISQLNFKKCNQWSAYVYANSYFSIC